MMKAQPENKTASGNAPKINYRKNSLEARLNELLPQGEAYSVTFFGLWAESKGRWYVNDAWTPLREVSREYAIEALRDRWEIFKLNYLPKARVRDIQDKGYESNESKLEVDCTAFADVTITNPIEDTTNETT